MEQKKNSHCVAYRWKRFEISENGWRNFTSYLVIIFRLKTETQHIWDLASLLKHLPFQVSTLFQKQIIFEAIKYL
jgi:hypothetical protein